MQTSLLSTLTISLSAVILSACGSKGTTSQTDSSDPRICFLDTFQQMGVISRDNPIGIADFHFVNTGRSAIVVLDVKPSCTCTTVEYDHSPVMPGDTSCIRAIYNGKGRNPEFFNKDIIVYTSASNEDVILTFEGELQ